MSEGIFSEKKRNPVYRSFGDRLRAWLRLAVLSPAMLGARMMRSLRVDVALYPDQFGHQALDVEHHLRSAKTFGRYILYLCGDYVPNRYLFKKHSERARVVRISSAFMRYARLAERTELRRHGRTLFYTVGFEQKMVDASIWTDVTPQIQFD